MTIKQEKLILTNNHLYLNLIIMKQYRLYLMMFFQYLMYAVWWVPLAAYLTNMDIGSTQKSFILSSMAIGCIASPIIGMIADRYFAGQKVLFGMNILNSLLDRK